MEETTSRRRSGSSLPLVLALVGLLGLLVAQLHRVTTGEAGLTRAQSEDAEHFYRAEAAASRVQNRLKKRPWSVRFYAEGGLGTGPFETRLEGEYRGGRWELWVADVEFGACKAVPGLVDLFCRVRLQDRERSFHYRVSLPEGSTRMASGVEVEWFSRVGEDLATPLGRAEAARRATASMAGRPANRELAARRLRRLPVGLRARLAGGPDEGIEMPGPGDLAEALLAAGAGDGSGPAAERALRKGIHLLGEDGRGLRSLLPPLERARFARRAADHASARVQLREALERGEDLDLKVQAAVALAQSYSAEAWKTGPASPAGRDLLRKAAEVLDAMAREMARAPLAELAALGPTWRASVPLEAARVAVLAEDETGAEEALVRASEAAGGATLYGGGSPVDQVLAEALGSLRNPASRTRIRSDQPLPPSGFEPLDPAEVEDFVADPAAGWGGWPADSGTPDPFWGDLWRDERGRDGEGGTPGPSGDIDRDGDGVLDPDTEIGGPDRDGDGTADGTGSPGPGVSVSVGVGPVGATAAVGSSGASATATAGTSGTPLTATAGSGPSPQDLLETRGDRLSSWALVNQVDPFVLQNPGDPVRLPASLAACTRQFRSEPAKMEACHRDAADRYLYFLGPPGAAQMPVYDTVDGEFVEVGTLVYEVKRGEGENWYQGHTVSTRWVPLDR